MRAVEAIEHATGEVITLDKSGLALPGRRTRVSLELPPNLTFDEWSSVGETLQAVEVSIQWWVGDWWAYGEAAYGGRKELADRLRVADPEFPAFQTCQNYGSVSRAFETSRRREVLSWSHHAEVASLPEDEADEVLDAAEREGWTKRETRAEVSRRKVARSRERGLPPALFLLAPVSILAHAGGARDTNNPEKGHLCRTDLSHWRVPAAARTT
jgi:hypothetical protein